jgi:glycosyltransferase involved in cell wall biosynthesis
MKVLLIGNVQSVFLTQLIEVIRKKKNIDFHGFSFLEGSPQTITNAYSHEKYMSREKRSGNWFIDLTYKVIYTFKIRKEIRELDDYDIIHIHSISPVYKHLIKGIIKKTNKLHLSFWGSDFYKSSDSQRKTIKAIIDQADKVSFTNEVMASDLLDYYKADSNLYSKVQICRFGIKTLELIDTENDSNEISVFNKKYNIPEGRHIVVVGYSASPNHQHKKIIDVLSGLPLGILKSCSFVFPMTYGSAEYRKELKKLLLTKDISYTVLDLQLTYQEIADLRKATDIFINLPMSDQFSASMQETIYAGGIVITGNWLPYDTFWKEGVKAVKIDDFSELKSVLLQVIRNLDEIRKDYSGNKDKIWKLSSWENTVNSWLNLYDLTD